MGFVLVSVEESPKFQVLDVIVTPEIVVVLFVKLNVLPLKHCVLELTPKSTTGAGLLDTVMVTCVADEEPQLLLAFTVKFPPLVDAVTLIALREDVPAQPEGMVQV